MIISGRAERRRRAADGMALLPAAYAEDGEDEYHGDDREEHTGDGTDGKVEPEDFL